MRTSLILTLIVLCGASLSSQDRMVLAASELQPWKVFVGDNVEGVDITILQKIAAEMRLQLTVIQAPLARCIAMAEQGKADIVSSVSPDPEREKTLYFLPTTYKGPNRKMFYVRVGGGVAIKGYDDLLKYTIGTKTGANYFLPFSSDSRLTLDPVIDDALNVKKLATGRIDCFIANEATGDYLVRVLGFSKQITKAAYFYESAASGQIAVSRISPLFARAAEMDRILKRMVDSGQVEAIKKHYLDSIK